MADINNYNSRINIYAQSYVQNGHGGYTVIKVLRDTVWCKITPLAGREALKYKQVYPTSQYKINIRYRPDVNEDNTLQYADKYHNILSVVDIDNKHDEIEMLTEVMQSEQ